MSATLPSSDDAARPAAEAADRAVLDGWWREVLATGGLPAALVPVQGRLVRAVGQGLLPSGPVFCKVMAFPRGRDRLRYCLRALPARHEARMLDRVARAGLPCPAVVAVRTARRFGLPFRSMLVLRALPAVVRERAPAAQLLLQARVARALVDAGLFHPDLNPDNFLELADGRLAVLDLQSMRPVHNRRAAMQQMAARLLLEAVDLPVADAVGVLAGAGLPTADAAALEALAAQKVLAFLRTRVRRCLTTATDYSRHATLTGCLHRQRAPLPPGRWVAGGGELRRCWLGQRLLELFEQRPPRLPAWRRRWWWLPRGGSVYVPAAIPAAQVAEELHGLLAGFARYRWLWARRPDRTLDELRRLRARCLSE